MSLPLEEIRYNILRAARRLYSSKVSDEVDKWINQSYFEIARMHSWHALRRKLEVDFTNLDEDDETGLLLPSSLMGIDRVRDSVNDIEFLRRDQSDVVQSDEYLFRYYTHQASQEAYVDIREGATVLNVAESGDTVIKSFLRWTFNPATFENATETDLDGEYVRLGTTPGYWKITGDGTSVNPEDGVTSTAYRWVELESRYYGPEVSSDVAVIRPPETLKMAIFDRGENILRDRSADIYYWEAPVPLWNDHDLCLLPISRLLELHVLIKLLGTIGKRQIGTDRYRGEYDDLLEESRRLNPDYARPSVPRGATNRMFGDTSNIFASRNEDTNDDLRYIFRRKT